jgi:hypothetical protein
MVREKREDGGKMKRLVVIALMGLGLALARDGRPAPATDAKFYGQEIITGTLHVMWFLQNSPQTMDLFAPGKRGLWISLHSDDPTVTSFLVTLIYRDKEGGKLRSIQRTIKNDPNANGSQGYWVADPSECIFWIGYFPDEITYSVVEQREHQPVLVKFPRE